MGGSALSAAGFTVGRVGSGRETSPEVLAFSPSELIFKIRRWSDRKRWNSKGRGRRRLLWLNCAEATGEDETTGKLERKE